MKSRKISIGKGTQLMAELQSKVHKLEIKGIKSQKDYFERGIRGADLLSVEQKDVILNHLKDLPEGNMLCHLDFHPGNVILSRNGSYVIDWSNSRLGNPQCDLSRTYYLYKNGFGPGDDDFVKKSIFHKLGFRLVKSAIASYYFRSYRKFSGMKKKEMEKWNLIIHASRLSEQIPEENDNIIAEIKKMIPKLHIN
jgi:aminoglycoside phosphotransferase (APT) family kinase protein